VQIALDDFDLLFDSLLGHTSAEGAASPASPEGTGQEQEDCIARAVALFHRGDYVRCQSLLQKCEAQGSRDVRVRAFLAASRSMGNGRVRDGVVACLEAIRGAFYIPDLYCALGVLLLRGGDRAKAHAAFQRGLRLDPQHASLKARLREMGERRTPVLGFLGRAHPANRVLGRMRAQLSTG
jgi:tetratricopeptide (TPR) repeat protein